MLMDIVIGLVTLQCHAFQFSFKFWTVPVFRFVSREVLKPWDAELLEDVRSDSGELANGRRRCN